MTTKSLWGDIPSADTVTAPVAVLRHQASELGRLTNNVLTGDVDTSTDLTYDRIEAGFWIVAPALGGYRYKLLRIRHDVKMYPVEIQAFSSPWVKCKDENEFVDWLGRFLSGEEAKKVIVSLLAQSRA